MEFRVALPLLKTCKYVDLNVTSDSLFLENRIYNLLLKTPHSIVPEKTRATFSCEERSLCIEMTPDYEVHVGAVEEESPITKPQRVDVQMNQELLDEVF